MPYYNQYGNSGFMKRKMKKFLKNEGLTIAAFARLIGVSPVSVSRYLSGDRFPDQKTMQSIYEATNGEVTPNDFYGIKTVREAEDCN